MEAKIETKKMMEVRGVKMTTLACKIAGTAPLLQHRMPPEVMEKLKADGAAGATKVKRKAPARDYESEYNALMHITSDGRCGHPASAFRNALIRAGQGEGLVMSELKSVLFIVADALSENGNPLVLVKGTPEAREDVIPGNGGAGKAVFIVRPMWREWRMVLRVRFDASRISAESVAALVQRAGETIGIGCGRPQSSNSNGIGMGTWTIEGQN